MTINASGLWWMVFTAGGCKHRNASDNDLVGDVLFLSRLHKLVKLKMDWNDFSGDLPDLSGAPNLTDVFVLFAVLQQQQPKSWKHSSLLHAWHGQ